LVHFRTFLLAFCLALSLLLAACGGSETTGDGEEEQGESQGSGEPAAGDRGSWQTGASLPEGRSEVAVAELDGRVYVIGGYTGETTSSTLNQVYDPATDTWEELAPMPRGLDHVGAAGYDGKVYAVSGFTSGNQGAVADVYAYDVATDSWEELTSLPAGPRGSVAVTQLDGRIHAIGGRDTENVGTHELYDPATGAWEELASLPNARDHMPAVVLDGRIHVPGGRFATFDNNTGIHEVYDPAADSWEEAASLPTPRSGTAGAALDGRLLVFGGEERAGTFEENETYDPSSDTWEELTPLPTPRHGFGAATVGETVYLPAGAPVTGGGRQSDVLEAFALP
jgi:N-acetylneuraminic acid mutarotase